MKNENKHLQLLFRQIYFYESLNEPNGCIFLQVDIEGQKELRSFIEKQPVQGKNMLLPERFQPATGDLIFSKRSTVFNAVIPASCKNIHPPFDSSGSSSQLPSTRSWADDNAEVDFNAILDIESVPSTRSWADDNAEVDFNAILGLLQKQLRF